MDRPGGTGIFEFVGIAAEDGIERVSHDMQNDCNKRGEVGGRWVVRGVRWGV